MASPGWDDVAAALSVRPPARVSVPVSARAAVAVILREGQGGLEMLFIRRAEHPADPWSGQMAFPGGRSEPGDADLHATAVRETREETGIDLAQEAQTLGVLDEVQAMARMRPLDLAITPYVFRLRGPGRIRLSAEVTSAHWLPLADLVDPGRRSTMEYTHPDGVLQFPCLRVQELVIWGLTFRMFLGLLERLGLPAGAATPLAAAAADSAAARAPGE